MSTANVRQQHAGWLAALDGDGPFLTVPALTERLRDGLVPTSPDQNRLLKAAHTRWTTAQPSEAADAQTEWVREVVTDLLGWGDHAEFTNLALWAHTDPTHRITTTPGFALLPLPAPETDSEVKPVLLGFTHPAGTGLTRRVGDGWPTTPIDRAIHAMRAHDIPLGIVTDGRWWALVWAPRQSTPGYALWSVDLLLDDELLRSAFITLLSRHRSLGVAEAETLHGLFVKSQDSQEDITQNLSRQVRKAVELLVDAFSSANRDAGDAYFRRTAGHQSAMADEGRGERIPDDEIYQAAVTLVMRLVFILAAEERRLLPSDDDFYSQAYGVGSLADRMIDRANREGEHILREASSAFPQLLATSRVIHDGVRHTRLNLPGYGGSVFDPTRFPWLETAPNRPNLGPIAVDDRTMLHILRGLTRWEGRRLSYRTLDVEQIGYAYEGLLDHTALTATETHLGLSGPREPEVPLHLLREQKARGETALVKWLKECTGQTPRRIEDSLASGVPSIDATARQRLIAACEGRAELAAEVEPYFHLLRIDERTGLPIVITQGTTYVTLSSARGDTGAHYTPKVFAEEVVKTALDALIYSPGPLDTSDATEWVLLPADRLLGLKVADIAMGSGAFLVAVIRYLADRLLEAVLRSSREALLSQSLRALWDSLHSSESARPEWDSSPDDSIVMAARRVIAARCIYGVDINPMAVEMTKLSIWLVTASRQEPFGFLNHRLLQGDSLLGVSDVRQIENLHVFPERGIARHGLGDGAMIDFTLEVRTALTRISELRRQIERQQVIDLRSVEEQERLFEESRILTEDLNILADGLIAASMYTAKASKGGGRDRELDARIADVTQHAPALFGARERLADEPNLRESIALRSAEWLDLDKPEGAFERKPLNWPLAFPEVFLGPDPGFSAVVGNPPFLGGKRISSAFGTTYEAVLKFDLRGARGAADLSAHFLRRAWRLTNHESVVGVITTAAINQGDSVAMGPEVVVEEGVIYKATTKIQWPTQAKVLVSLVFATRLPLKAHAVLNGREVESIGPTLADQDEPNLLSCAPLTLPFSASIGTGVYGEGLLLAIDDPLIETLSQEERARLRKYINGKELVGTVGVKTTRWAIDLGDVPNEDSLSRMFPVLHEHLRRTVKPVRDALKGQIHQDCYWKFWDIRLGLYRELSQLQQVIVGPVVTRVPTFALIDTENAIFSSKVVVIASEDYGLLGLLNSSVHWAWIEGTKTDLGSKSDTTYVVSRCLRPFPLPEEVDGIRSAAVAYDEIRRGLLATRSMTDVMLLLDDPDDRTTDQLRAAKIALDSAALDAYGWSDLATEYGFLMVSGTRRFELSSENRSELRRRLARLNHQRVTQDAAAELVGDGRRSAGSRGGSAKRQSRASTGVSGADAGQQGLFESPLIGQGIMFEGSADEGA